MSPIFYAIRLGNATILNMILDSHHCKYLNHMKTGKGFSPVQYA